MLATRSLVVGWSAVRPTAARSLANSISSSSSAVESYKPDAGATLKFPEQTVFVGKSSIKELAAAMKASGAKKPLIVTDAGIVKVGIADKVVAALKENGVQTVVFDGVHENPPLKDVVGIANAHLKGGCDAIIGLGGGGPLDASKGGAALVAQRASKAGFDLNKDGEAYLANQLKKDLSAGLSNDFTGKVPYLAGIPTTSGTGSEGGKSAVLTKSDGSKLIFGNKVFMPRAVALNPELTVGMPKQLTAATGMDALFHNLEAYFVTHKAAINDGMNDAEIKVTDDYAIRGLRLVLRNLPTAVEKPNDLTARLNMQVAALFGAKAFRKGDLGGVHATAHAVGGHYHLHHGACITRMSVPVLHFNQVHTTAKETTERFDILAKEFAAVLGGDAAHSSLSVLTHRFIKKFGMAVGIRDLNPTEQDIARLTELAMNDGCQTNPVVLTKENYDSIFRHARALRRDDC